MYLAWDTLCHVVGTIAFAPSWQLLLVAGVVMGVRLLCGAPVTRGIGPTVVGLVRTVFEWVASADEVGVAK